MTLKNPFAGIAYTYSGSPWFLWISALTQTLLVLLFFFPLRRSFPEAPFVGALSALIGLWYYGAIIYYLAHRAQFVANPAKPIRYSVKQVAWTVVITLAVIAVFVALEAFVWHS